MSHRLGLRAMTPLAFGLSGAEKRLLLLSLFKAVVPELKITFQLGAFDGEHVESQQLQEPVARQGHRRVLQQRPKLLQHLHGGLLEALHPEINRNDIKNLKKKTPTFHRKVTVTVPHNQN